jgi:hypothetical protein
MAKLTPGQIGGIVATVVGLNVSRNGMPDVYPGDVVAFIILGLMLFWFLRPSRDDASRSQRPDDSFAFRLCKALKRVLRGNSGGQVAPGPHDAA